MKIHIGPYRKNRRVQVQIDDYDIWSMDHTLSLIIVEMLKKLKENAHGYPGEFSDPDWRKDGVNYGGDGGGMEAWHNVLDQMIEGFGYMASETWPSYSQSEIARAQHALKLFAHFYMALWD